jgi:hypothetical protein
MREVTNHIVSTALSRVDVDLTAIYLTPGLYAESGAQAWCRPEYDEEAKQAKATIFVDRAAYDGAKNNTNLMVRYLFLLTHEVGHGIEPAYAEKPAALTGLVFNLLYDARLSVQPYIDYDPNTFIDERVANLYCCSLMLEEFGFALKGNLQMSADVEYLQIQMSYEQQYGGLITENARRLLPLLFPEISSRFNSQPIFGTSIANDVIAAYTAGVIAPNDKLFALFDRGGSFGLPSYGEFIKYMDAAYSIGQITSGLKEEMINGINVTELKQFTLCAPFILGMKDTPYTDYSYDKYLDDLYAEHTDVTRMKDIDRMFVTDWAASISNADFSKIIKPYL